MSEKKVPANKRPEILVSENAVKKGWYAIQFTERQYLTRDNSKWNDNTFVDYYSPRDFEQFKRYRGTAWYVDIQIIHDPTLPVEKQEPPNVVSLKGTASMGMEETTPNKGGRPRKNT